MARAISGCRPHSSRNIGRLDTGAVVDDAPDLCWHIGSEFKKPSIALIAGGRREQTVGRKHFSGTQPFKGINESNSHNRRDQVEEIRRPLRIPHAVREQQPVLRMRPQVNRRQRVAQVYDSRLLPLVDSCYSRWTSWTGVNNRYVGMLARFAGHGSANVMGVSAIARSLLPVTCKPKCYPSVVDDIQPARSDAVVLKEWFDSRPRGTRNHSVPCTARHLIRARPLLPADWLSALPSAGATATRKVVHVLLNSRGIFRSSRLPCDRPVGTGY